MKLNIKAKQKQKCYDESKKNKKKIDQKLHGCPSFSKISLNRLGIEAYKLEI